MESYALQDFELQYFEKNAATFFIPSTDTSTHYPIWCDIPYESLEWESNILKFIPDALKIAIYSR